MNTALHFSSASSEWETPQDLFDRLDAKYHFTLDVCATAENAKCESYYDKEMDGLKQSWAPETCWLNPPYGRGIGQWIEKAEAEAQNGACVVILAPSRTDTAWFFRAFKASRRTIFLRGRLRFGGHMDSAPFPSVLFDMAPAKFGMGLVEIKSVGEL